jgi:hypothetical protein
MTTISKDTWGSVYWDLLHLYSSVIYDPAVDRENAKQFMNTIRNTLPCPQCQHHMDMFMQQNNINKALQTKDSFAKYIFNLHNEANKNSKKPLMSYATFYRIYLNKNSLSYKYKKSNSCIKTIVIYFLLIIVSFTAGGLSVYLYNKK